MAAHVPSALAKYPGVQDIHLGLGLFSTHSAQLVIVPQAVQVRVLSGNSMKSISVEDRVVALG